jgi:hypothetical protein
MRALQVTVLITQRLQSGNQSNASPALPHRQSSCTTTTFPSLLLHERSSSSLQWQKEMLVTSLNSQELDVQHFSQMEV